METESESRLLKHLEALMIEFELFKTLEVRHPQSSLTRSGQVQSLQGSRVLGNG
jgi:hypothetical protein